MNQNQFCKLKKQIIIFIISSIVSGIVHKPTGKEDAIKLTIHGSDRIYYELDGSLSYNNIGKQFEIGDSIAVAIYSRTIKAPTGKRNRNYGFNVKINDNELLQLKYKKEGSQVTSPDRPGWNYTKSGMWYFYLPVRETGYQISVEPLTGNPIVYIRLTSNKVEKKGNYEEVIKTLNVQERISIETEKGDDIVSTLWYLLENTVDQQFEIKGPAKVRMFSRALYNESGLDNDYKILVKEDGIDLGTFYFTTEKSHESVVKNSNNAVGKWRSLWLTIPEGKHYYHISLAKVKGNKDKKVFIRMKRWVEE